MNHIEEILKKYDPIWKILCSIRQKGKESCGKKLLRQAKKVMDIDDITSACYVGVCKAQKKYDPSKNVKFDTFACRGCYLELRKELANYAYFKGKDYDKWPKRSHSNLDRATKEEWSQIDLTPILSLLNQTCAQIFRRYFGIDHVKMTYAEIAMELSVPEFKVRKIIQDCTNILRDEFEGRNLFSPVSAGPRENQKRLNWKEWADQKSGCIL